MFGVRIRDTIPRQDEEPRLGGTDKPDEEQPDGSPIATDLGELPEVSDPDSTVLIGEDPVESGD